jgi:hypothetical protein
MSRVLALVLVLALVVWWLVGCSMGVTDYQILAAVK